MEEHLAEAYAAMDRIRDRLRTVPITKSTKDRLEILLTRLEEAIVAYEAGDPPDFEPTTAAGEGKLGE
jgi:hypothetical protein